MTLFHALGPFAAQAGVVAAPGMVLLTPTSITHSGTSASIGANGQVTFTAVTSLSLNGVFSADFDNYVISLRSVSNINAVIRARFRASGTDASGATDYISQELAANGTSVGANRYNQDYARVGATVNTQRSGDTIYIYGPYLAQPTAWRDVNIRALSDAQLNDHAGTHSLSTSYDGISFLFPLGNMTGALQVYGVRS